MLQHVFVRFLAASALTLAAGAGLASAVASTADAKPSVTVLADSQWGASAPQGGTGANDSPRG
ncbi:hypothetical protein [Streptomyces tropicalis]|uniref:Uncharacterized protein n=1 Tax=Streptomyces tropicalis TaxID=3034234 RepID=A0ABT6A874_9ACTN|nr:hypothetical protein [Streptomyces tropicalis]MDF3300833.1 hypothetical protein [Streptomyces tropicalis]